MLNSQSTVFCFFSPSFFSRLLYRFEILDGKINCEDEPSQNFLEVAYLSSLSWCGWRRVEGGGGGGPPPACLSTVIRSLWSRSGGLAMKGPCHIREE